MAAPWATNSLAGALESISTIGQGSVASSARADRSIYGSGSVADSVEGQAQTARTSGGTGCTRSYPSFASGNNLASWKNAAGTEVLRIRSTAALTVQLQYWDGAAWPAVGAAIVMTTAIDYRHMVDFAGMGGASGTLTYRIVADATETLQGTSTASGLNLTSATDIARMRVYSAAGSTSAWLFGEFFIKDGSALSAYVYSNKPTSNGTDATDGTGTFTDVDDTSTSMDTDFVSLPTSGNKRSFKAAARATGGRSIKGVSVSMRLRCGASGPTQVKPYLLISGVRYYHASSPVTLTTTISVYVFTWELDPSTTAVWTNAAAESANLEFGYEVV